jgi:hypothetical protein
VSVVLHRAGEGFLFRFACDAGCSRPAILATSLPSGWESLRATDGQILHAAPAAALTRSSPASAGRRPREGERRA